MKQSIKQYIEKAIKKNARIGYDKSTKSWYGTLDHKVGLMLSQAESKTAVKKELTEIFEDFIILSLNW